MKQSDDPASHLVPLHPQARLTRTQRKILDVRNAIYFQPQPESEDLTFSARELVQATLPHQTPRGNPPEWYRTNGNYTLSIRPGYKTDEKTGNRRCIGYPYGNVPRLLLFWLTTEALRTGSRRLELGGSLAAFMRELGLDPSRGGRWSDRTRLYDQTERLFNASISFEFTGNDRRQWINMEVASQGEMWWDFKQPAQQDLFASWVELGEKFYEAIIAHPVPLDMRTLQALKSSSLALDIYAWLAYRSHRVNRDKKAVFVSWTQLHQQFGASYYDVKGFKRYAKVALHKVLAVYAHLKVEEVRGGIKINPGYPLITSR
jgi:Plasmid encoded RepA protein